MKLTVLLFASLRERAGREALEVAGLAEPLDVAALKRELERRHPELGSLDSARAVLGTRYVADAAPLEDGMELALLPPVSGGAPDDDLALERGLFELSAEPLDPGAAQERVEHPACGACVVFTGLTRESSRGQRVLRLEYEAFEAMAGPEMARIFERCRAEHGGEAIERRLRMLVQHRTGTVEVGQPSVVIAVASPHRERAFQACRFLIDELKRSLPVWKKEHFEDGSAWVGERS